jgi:hypothetical protein
MAQNMNQNHKQVDLQPCDQQGKWDKNFEKSKHTGKGPYQNSSTLNPGSQFAFHKTSA